MKKTCEKRREAIIHQINQIEYARRGQLSEQYYERRNAEGKTVRTGPYYVWQRYVNGKKKSVRIKADQIEHVRKELEQGKNLQALMEELWAIIEETAQQADTASKKKSSKRRISVKPKRR